MARYWQHIPNQAAGLRALGGLLQKAALDAIRPERAQSNSDESRRPLVGMTVRRQVQLPPIALQHAFVRFCGGEPSRYAGRTPPHLFAQWILPAALSLAKRLPFPPLSVVNLGCSLRIDGPLPDRGEVSVHSTVTDVSERDGKVLLTLGLLTLFQQEVRLRAELRLLVRLASASNSARPKTKRQTPLVPHGARELLRRRLGVDAGLEFAQLTGDFNPVHWSRRYARMVGFKSSILHGFGSFALAYEGLVSGRLSGRFDDVRRIDAEFAAPLLLPREIGVFSREDELWVADAPSGPAYMAARVFLV
jgi:MaoC like domain